MKNFKEKGVFEKDKTFNCHNQGDISNNLDDKSLMGKYFGKTSITI